MWTLHKLKSSKRSRIQPEVDSPKPSRTEGAGRDAQQGEWVGEVPLPPPSPLHLSPPHLASPWDFAQEEFRMFPALCKRNFWCVQRHQARALHYDLRMQLDGTTFSWAIPRGLLGISKTGERNRLAVETTLHPISYTTYEGGDGRVLPSGERCGTLLWDVGTYTIDYPWKNHDSDSEDEKRHRRKRRREGSEGSDDPTGQHEEDKFRMAMQRPVRLGKSRSIHFTLKGGKKLDNHSYILIQSPQNAMNKSFSSTGRQKVNWFISLPRGVQGYAWGAGGEEGDEHGRSVKTGRTLREVCAARERIVTFQSEQERFGGWAGDVIDVDPGDGHRAKRRTS